MINNIGLCTHQQYSGLINKKLSLKRNLLFVINLNTSILLLKILYMVLLELSNTKKISTLCLEAKNLRKQIFRKI
jgi:hypothetical protein